MNDFVASFFKFQERKTTWQRETIGGITSFVTMAYIIFVNPQIMAAAGMDKGTVMLATCLAAAAGTLLMALYANAPFGLAPGMGINAFFAYTLCGAMGYTWEQGLGCYPRSTFYPLSDGVSIHIRRITMPQFPACSACLPPSQAPLCHCTL